jgi:hypothetical protein
MKRSNYGRRSPAEQRADNVKLYDTYCKDAKKLNSHINPIFTRKPYGMGKKP